MPLERIENVPETVQMNVPAPQPLSREAYFAVAPLLPNVTATPRMIVGTAGLGGVYGKHDQAAAIRTLHRAWDQGLLITDSSFLYGNGQAESVLDAALKQRGKSDVIAITKLEPIHEKGQSWADSFAQQWRGIQERIGYPITALAMHDPDTTDDQAFGPACHEFLLQLQKRGEIQTIGLGGGGAQYQPVYMRTNAYHYMITFRRLSAASLQAMGDTVPVAQAHKVKVFAASPVFMGMLTPKLDEHLAKQPERMAPIFLDRARKLRDLANGAGISLTHLALRFLLSAPMVDSIITGADDPATWADTKAAYDAGPLDAEVFASVWRIAQEGEEPTVRG